MRRLISILISMMLVLTASVIGYADDTIDADTNKNSSVETTRPDLEIGSEDIDSSILNEEISDKLAESQAKDPGFDDIREITYIKYIQNSSIILKSGKGGMGFYTERNTDGTYHYCCAAS